MKTRASMQPLMGHKHERRHRGLSAIITIGLVTALMAAGCGTGTDGSGSASSSAPSGKAVPTTEDPAVQPKAGGKINFALVAETDGWNPASSRWAASGLDVSRAIFDTLGAFDDKGQVQPYLAQAIDHNADFTEWTIKVRPGVTFHDGTLVDGAAVKANLDAFKKSALTGGALGAVSTIDLVDAATVKVNMSTPWSTYPVQLASQVGTIASPKTLSEPDGARHPIGSGPFVFDAWTPDNKLTVRKNTTYWQKGYPRLDNIEFRIITDDKSRATSLRSGDIDAMENFDPGTEDAFRAPVDADRFRIHDDPKNETDEAMVMLNTTKAPFDDPVARRALAHATDPQALADLLSPSLEIASSPYRKGTKWYTYTGYPVVDVEAAKKDVEAYKATHGGKFAFQLDGIPVLEVQRVEQFLQQQWGAVGMDVTINNVEQARLINQAIAGTYQATMWRQFGSPNPDGEYVWWHGSNAKGPGEISLNFARNKDPEIDRALDAARATNDEAKQKEAWDRVQKLHAKDLPYIWLYHSTAGVITSVRVHDLTNSKLPDGQKALGQVGVTHDWNQVWIG